MKGKNSCEEKSKLVCLSDEQMKQILTPFYETVCLDVTDDTRIITYIPNLHVSTRFLM